MASSESESTSEVVRGAVAKAMPRTMKSEVRESVAASSWEQPARGTGSREQPARGTSSREQQVPGTSSGAQQFPGKGSKGQPLPPKFFEDARRKAAATLAMAGKRGGQEQRPPDKDTLNGDEIQMMVEKWQGKQETMLHSHSLEASGDVPERVERQAA